MATEADNIWETGAEPPREPPPRFRVLRRLAGGIAVALLALLALGVLNPLGHDDTDRLPPPLRKSLVQALRSAPGCSGWMPNARIASISRLSNDVGLENGFRYRCTWTLLGWPSFSGVARCADGAWIVPGWMEPEQTSTKCGVLTNQRIRAVTERRCQSESVSVTLVEALRGVLDSNVADPASAVLQLAQSHLADGTPRLDVMDALCEVRDDDLVIVDEAIVVDEAIDRLGGAPGDSA